MSSAVVDRLKIVASRPTLRLTHYGRKSRKPYEVTIWFVAHGEIVYLSTANVNRQWVRNVRKTPRVRMRIDGETFYGEARFLEGDSERTRVMTLVRKKYWMYRPVLWISKLLAAFGIMRLNTGAFEVRLTDSQAPSDAAARLSPPGGAR